MFSFISALIWSFSAAKVSAQPTPAPRAEPVPQAVGDAVLETERQCQNPAFELEGLATALRGVPEGFGQVFAGMDELRLAESLGCKEAVNHFSCDALQGAGRPVQDAYKQCRHIASDVQLIWFAFSGGDPSAACLPAVSLSRFRSAEAKKACRVLAQAIKEGSSSEAACSGLKEAGVWSGGRSGHASCERWLLFIHGSPDECRKLIPATTNDGVDLNRCVELAQFVAAARSHDSARCAASPFCRALSAGRPEFCEPYVAQARQALCAKAKVKAQQVVLQRRQAASRRPQFRKGQPMKSGRPPESGAAQPAEAPADTPAEKGQTPQ